jgi:hypothetical protein
MGRYSCYWFFDRSDLLESLVDQFIAGEATVDPKEFNRLYGKIKQDMFSSAPEGRRKAR